MAENGAFILIKTGMAQKEGSMSTVETLLVEGNLEKARKAVAHEGIRR